MDYRNVGRSGLRVSVLSFGSWVTFGSQLDDELALGCMQAAWDAGGHDHAEPDETAVMQARERELLAAHHRSIACRESDRSGGDDGR